MYVPANPTKTSLVWVGRDGSVQPTSPQQDLYREATLAPDGRTAIVRHGVELWLHDLERGARSRVAPATLNVSNMFAAWTRDGARIVYASNRGGEWDLYAQMADGSQPAQRLLARPGNQFSQSVGADGRVLFMEQPTETGRDL